MITDKIENLKNYKEIPTDAINKFLSGIQNGKHIISDNCYINVEEYTTKDIVNAKFEAHKNYIDVQILLNGKEDIYYTDVNDNLTVQIPYDENKDIMFYSDSVNSYNKVTLDGSNFVLLYPTDAHAPQVATTTPPEKVKKVVIKIHK